jgi:hypothetical protein
MTTEYVVTRIDGIGALHPGQERRTLTLPEMTLLIEALVPHAGPETGAAHPLIVKLMDLRGCQECGALDYTEGPHGGATAALCQGCWDKKLGGK